MSLINKEVTGHVIVMTLINLERETEDTETHRPGTEGIIRMINLDSVSHYND